MAEATSPVETDAATARKALAKADPKFEVKFDDPQNDGCDAPHVPMYTSGDEVKGHATITCQADLPFANVRITLEGACKTYVENAASTAPTNNRRDGYLKFLEIHQLIKRRLWPQSERVLEAHKPYIFPFKFLVPSQLPEHCQHRFDDMPADAHATVPATIGHPGVPTWGSCKDDMCPNMAGIMYKIRCSIKGKDGSWHSVLRQERNIGICPVVEEAPPLHVRGGEHDDYVLRVEKTIKQGTLRKKLGRIVAEATQPSSFRLHSIHSEDDCPITTSITVNLRFDPLACDSEELPQPAMLDVKLKAATFFAVEEITGPITKAADFRCSFNKGVYVESIRLACHKLSKTKWEVSQPGANPPEDVSGPTDHPKKIPTPSKYYEGHTFYTATLTIPLELKSLVKTCIPTFHYCLMSRIYALDLNMAFEQPRRTLKNPTICLKLPIQISCEENPLARPGASANLTTSNSPIGEEASSGSNHGRNAVADRSNQSSVTSTATANGTGTEALPAHLNGSTVPKSSGTEQTSNCNNGLYAGLPPAQPGYAHRSSWAPGVVPERPAQVVPMSSAQTRLNNLAFIVEDTEARQREEDDDDDEEEQPPDYSDVVNRPRGGWRRSVFANASPFRRASTSTMFR